MFPEIVRLVEDEIEQISADGSYDRRKVYAALNERGIRRATISPRKGAKIWFIRTFSARLL